MTQEGLTSKLVGSWQACTQTSVELPLWPAFSRYCDCKQQVGVVEEMHEAFSFALIFQCFTLVRL